MAAVATSSPPRRAAPERGLWALVAASVFATTACLRSSVLEADVPTDVDRIAVVELDAEGALVRATELVEWRPGTALPIIAAGARDVIVVGWRSTALEAVGASLDALAGARLEPATGCALAVPAPSWTARWTTRGVLEVVDAAVVPPLTARWMERACGAFAASRIRIDVPCADRRCPQPVIAPGECGFELDLSSCGVGVVRGRVDHAGALCVELSSDTCTRVDADAPFAAPPARFACDGSTTCAPDVHVEPPLAEAPFTADTVRIVDRPPHLPDSLRTRPTVAPWQLTTGYGLDAVAVDDLVFVTFIDSPTLECELRAGSVDTQLHGYDSDTLERVVARVLPSCADRIVPDGRGGFVLTFFEDGAWKLGRFDRTGARLVTRTLSVPGPGMPESSIVDDLAVVADPPRIAVLFGPTFEGTAPPTITQHDVDTLFERSKTTLELGRAYSMTDDGRGRLVVSANGSEELAWYDVSAARLEGRAALPFVDVVHAQMYRPVADVAFPQTLVPVAGDSTLVVFGPSRDVRGRRTPFSEEVQLLTAGLRWSARPDLVLFAGGTDHGAGDRRVAVTFFDPATEKFLPGVHELGFGVPSGLFEDHRGRAWLLVPWAAELVRLTPR